MSKDSAGNSPAANATAKVSPESSQPSLLPPVKAPSPAVESQSVDSELASAKARIAELEAANKSLQESAGSMQGRFPVNSRGVGATKKRWMFTVQVIGASPYPPQDIEAIDESEAIRMFVLTADPSGKALDTVKYTVKAQCKTEEISKQRKAHTAQVRAARNFENGHDLSPQAAATAAAVAVASR